MWFASESHIIAVEPDRRFVILIESQLAFGEASEDFGGSGLQVELLAGVELRGDVGIVGFETQIVEFGQDVSGQIRIGGRMVKGKAE